MANAVASMTGLNVISQPSALEGGLRCCSSSRNTLLGAPKIYNFISNQKKSTPTKCSSTVAPEQSEGEISNRRSMLGFLAATVAVGAMAKTADAAPTEIKVAGPPAPFGGLPGTENADQARDLDLPLKDRFFIQPLTPGEAVSRIKESAEEIVGVKNLIAKKAWPYVQNDLRNRASYLRYDLNTVISSKPKDEKKSLKALTSKLFETIDKLDYAARSKSLPEAEKYYAETVSALNTVINKIA
ncbi:hypothetical protein O6H91_13G038700 [Diphasiastrum complanatum]|uniref:Uncharacterized protein n=1 Tax=Diphasiastrum complanatum TaxID=34168 RepID=A0ACC2BTU4_DIPCM|nr:hypothetical protein O6H91_13G038700 [Diphasiastrum complanatum]